MQETYFEEKMITDQKLQKYTAERCKFIDCEFRNCSFEECSITGCTFVNCKFTNCTIISLTSRYSEVKNAVFQKCNLIGVHWNDLLPSGKYAHSIEQFENCQIKYNTFSEMNFIRFHFSGNSIQESVFEQCNLSESNFLNCRLDGTQIFESDLRKADFRGATGYLIDITSSKMKEARFSFPEAINLLNSLGVKID